MAAAGPSNIEYQEAHRDESRQPTSIGVLVVCMVIAYSAVVLRIVARRKSHVPLKADDWWIIGSLVPTTVYDGLNFWAIHAGIGLHLIRVKDPESLVKSAIACEIFYGFCLPPIKISILYLYHRIFPSKRLWQASIVIAAIVIGATIAASVAWGLQCIPLSSTWTGEPGRCVNVPDLAHSFAAINIITDVAILCLPLPSLWNLQVSRPVRAGLIATFALGGCVCIFSIVRAYEIGITSVADPSWNDAPGGVWSNIEVHVAVLSACLPTYRSFFPRSSSRNSSSRNKNSRRTGDEGDGIQLTADVESSLASMRRSEPPVSGDGFDSPGGRSDLTSIRREKSDLVIGKEGNSYLASTDKGPRHV